MNPSFPEFSRRDLLAAAASSAVLAAGTAAPAAEAAKTYRVGVISATIQGKSQPRNGHNWHFAQYLHPACDLDALKKLYPYGHPKFKGVFRNPKMNFDQLPFPDTAITHYYDPDPKVAAEFCQAFPGVKVAESVEKMVQEVDAVWLGDASGLGDDHFDLVAPGLAKGLPTFCDKPIGGSVEGTKKILAFARKHGAPLMSCNIWRTEFGMEAALRFRDAGAHGPIEHVSARLYSHMKMAGWMVYGQHPLWAVITLMGAGVEAVSLVEAGNTLHGLVTFPDRSPCHVWCGQPYEKFEYDRTDVYFTKKLFSFTPSIDGDYDYGYHYSMFRLAATFREMVRTRKEPVPHQEILEVTAAVHAGAKSVGEKSRLVKLEELLG